LGLISMITSEDRLGRESFCSRWPAASLVQYPLGGLGMLCFLQILANPTSDSPYSFAYWIKGVSHTRL
jgi:hypothetical protein